MNSFLEISKNKLLLGDAFKYLPKLPDNSIDLVLTDIPYGVVNRESAGIRKFDKGNADIVDNIDLALLIAELYRICKGSMYIFCSTEQVSELRKSMVDRGLTTRLCIWEKTNPSPVNGQHLWLSGVETCVFGRKSGAVFNEHCKNTVWRFPNGRSKFHPTEKPLNLFKFLVKASSNPGDIVLDPFVGSGTTAVACVQTNRNFIGIEIDLNCLEIAKARLAGM